MKKLFTNDKLFLIMVILRVVTSAVYVYYEIFLWDGYINEGIQGILRTGCIVAIYLSYRNHNKNVMKGLIGSLLMAEVISALTFASIYENTFDFVCTVIYGVLTFALFINHFVINSDRHARPANIKISQIIVVLLVINQIVVDSYWLVIEPIPTVANFIGYMALLYTVVSVESRLDAYRLDREAAGWTEEKGYPEGYVHEYEKNENK